MKFVRIPFRLVYIAFVLARYRIDELILHSAWFYPFRFVSYFNPMRYISAKKLSPGKRLCCALEQLGPIFIKFGQLLSTRRDLLLPEIADELAKLQDKVEPFPSKQAKAIIEEGLGGRVGKIFAEFSDEPLASASIAQVHAAKLLSGEDVVVKVLRPEIKKKINNDLEILKIIAKLANHFLPNSKRLRPVEIVEEFEMTLNAEQDLMREAANASILRRNFADSDELYIPQIYWEYCKKNIMVMERIYGIPIYKTDQLIQQGTDLKELAETGLDIFFTQVFEHNFFHADMHPGNFFVSQENKQQYIAVDFGIVGSLSESDRRYIAENLLAFFERDYRRVALLHIESGWVDDDVRIDDFEAAIRTVSEPVFGRPLKDISMGQVVLNLFRIARQFNFTIQPQLILLQKSLFHIESLARNLYPELDLWNTVKPYLQQWLRKELGPKQFIRKLKMEFPRWADKLPEIPELLYDALQTIKNNQVQPIKTVKKPIRKIRSFTSLFLGAGIGLLIGSALSMYHAVSFTMPWIMFGVGLGLLTTSLLIRVTRK